MRCIAAKTASEQAATMAPVKRALSSYMLFCNDQRKSVTDENPGARALQRVTRECRFTNPSHLSRTAHRRDPEAHQRAVEGAERAGARGARAPHYCSWAQRGSRCVWERVCVCGSSAMCSWRRRTRSGTRRSCSRTRRRQRRTQTATPRLRTRPRRPAPACTSWVGLSVCAAPFGALPPMPRTESHHHSSAAAADQDACARSCRRTRTPGASTATRSLRSRRPRCVVVVVITEPLGERGLRHAPRTDWRMLLHPPRRSCSCSS